MTSIRARSASLASLVLVVVCVISFASCKRISPGNSAEQSVVPGGSSPTPSPCTVPFNGDFVNDSAGVMDSDSRAKLEQKLDTLKSAGSIDFAVVTVKTTGEQPIADYSLALARCWNLGESNPDKLGLLLLLAVDDRKWHMQISRRMEKVLSNDEIQQAAALMTAELRNQNYAQGIDKCVDATIRTIAPRRKFSMQ
jgi:uncharacterized membrane protein YgcG